MAAFEFYEAPLLKKTVSHLKDLAEPGNTATFNFSPKGISLLASSQDDQVIGALRFNLGSLSRFICNHPHSLGVNLDQLLTVLDLANDEDSVHVGASEELCQFIFRIRNLDGQEICRNVDFIPPNPMHVVLEQIPHQYAVKTAIDTPILIVTLSEFLDYDVQDKIAIIVRNSEVEITIGAATEIFFKELNECFIQGFTGDDDDDDSYLAEFNFERLISLDESIHMTNYVWIYPPYCDGSPHVLQCPIDHLGTVTYYFQ
ncbi:hypothetical protein JRO89_XS01G0028700 [Xanthoceras sorbifolium]|uniref:Proliferating cell nuclear antigen PCNA N-terminal domain-containing protein n=1 Tax=Xanthoceras sorbifolium TaxID=99658 RepID=A0ABQ8IIG7_9ROSI|nr:hypothetical protein JRO89_XS01G0028700 [Xanthoceras sorbifolium]